MKTKITLTIFLLISIVVQIHSQSTNDTIFVASWNMENLFDTIDDADKRDEEFLPNGKKEWTQDKIDLKIQNQAKVISWMNNGKGPDLMGFQEVEHQHLIDTLLQRYFSDKNYKVAYAEAPDKRGIDNGLIYNADKFEVTSVKPIEVELPSKYPTRYVLLVNLKTKTDDVISIFINHWPSRGGGEEKSRPNRIKAASVLRDQIDSLYMLNQTNNIIIVGDFNDTPTNLSIARYLWTQDFDCETIINPNRLYNLASSEAQKKKGTYLYRGTWNMLDQIIISSELLGNKDIKYVCNSFELIKPDFLIQHEGKYKGSAMPTFGGRKYLGGYSDHIPVGAKFIILK